MQGRFRRCVLLPRRFLYAKNHEPKGQERRNDCDPKHDGEIACGQHHQPDRRQRPYEGANGIQRLTQAEARTPQIGRAQIGNESIAWCSADALSQAIYESGRHQPAYICRERKNGLDEGREAITKRGQRLAPSEPIAKRAGENLGDHRRCFSDTFDESPP
jgi:hypothetical protein